MALPDLSMSAHLYVIELCQCRFIHVCRLYVIELCQCRFINV
jgi:hypothetical protein